MCITIKYITLDTLHKTIQKSFPWLWWSGCPVHSSNHLLGFPEPTHFGDRSDFPTSKEWTSQSRSSRRTVESHRESRGERSLWFRDSWKRLTRVELISGLPNDSRTGQSNCDHRSGKWTGHSECHLGSWCIETLFQLRRVHFWLRFIINIMKKVVKLTSSWSTGQSVESSP